MGGASREIKELRPLNLINLREVLIDQILSISVAHSSTKHRLLYSQSE
jgi:hypothetical protein